VVTDEGVVVVDPIGGPNAHNPEILRDAISSVTDQPVRYLVYSHWAPDHGTGSAVFADTAEFVSTRRAAELLTAANPPTSPVPTITFDDQLTIELGGKTFNLYAAQNAPQDQYLIFHYPEGRVVMTVDFIRVHELPFRDLQSTHPDYVVRQLQWIEDNLDFDTLVWGHAAPNTALGTHEDVRATRQYFLDLTAAIRAAQAAGLADNSDEMLNSVRAQLEPTYGSWNNFAATLPLNVEGALRWWSQQ
jgi:glyoxylase-like metal-dependent hydrolase (beta-lactamase superfamily II)